MRFSTKYDDDESDLLYYGYRYYKASTGTWPNKDPKQEKGGLNLYAFTGNDSINHIDLIGLSTGTISASGRPLVEDSFAFHARGWDMSLHWTAPTSGDWAKPCACKPCQRAIWLQEYKDSPNGSWQPDTTETSWHNWNDYGNGWGCAGIPPGGTAAVNQDNLYTADTFDQPQIDRFSWLGLWLQGHDYFEALSYVKCIQGKDAGKIYGSVIWGYTWSYDSTPAAIGPFIR
jgi:RHS repeat-associated protein